jgi:phosphoserine phosphatase RsbU/P
VVGAGRRRRICQLPIPNRAWSSAVLMSCGTPVICPIRWAALLGVLAHPELHDSRRLLRAGDSLVFFSDGVTEARSGADRDVYGDERLRGLVARLGDLTAVAMAEAVQLAVLTFGGGRLSDDTVALVMKVPPA